MYNAFLTLLLNLSDESNPNEFISQGFNQLTLPAPLQNFYSVIFPSSTSRYYKNFLACYYLQVLKATFSDALVTGLDPRITYCLNDFTQFFQINRASSPINPSPQFPIIITGTYSTSNQLQTYQDSFIIQQVDNTEAVTVYSVTLNAYLKGSKTYTNYSSRVIINTPISGSTNSSAVIPVGNTGLFFQLQTIGGADFTSTYGKSWQFTAEAPLQFNLFPTVIDVLASHKAVVLDMFAYNTQAGNISYENLWYQHFNSLYRFAGALNSYVLRVNSLWQATSK